MRRRATIGRSGPGLMGSMVRTAAIAGTATATSAAVGGAMSNAKQQKQAAALQQQTAAQQQALAEQQAAAEQQAQVDALQQSGAVPAAAPAAGADIMTQLQQLAEMKQSGLLTDEEFAAAKAKLLGG